MKKKWRPKNGDLVICHFYDNKFSPYGVIQEVQNTPYGYYSLKIFIDGNILNCNSYRCSLV
jgi:hypothetical protein